MGWSDMVMGSIEVIDIVCQVLLQVQQKNLRLDQRS